MTTQTWSYPADACLWTNISIEGKCVARLFCEMVAPINLNKEASKNRRNKKNKIECQVWEKIVSPVMSSFFLLLFSLPELMGERPPSEKNEMILHFYSIRKKQLSLNCSKNTKWNNLEASKVFSPGFYGAFGIRVVRFPILLAAAFIENNLFCSNDKTVASITGRYRN